MLIKCKYCGYFIAAENRRWKFVLDEMADHVRHEHPEELKRRANDLETENGRAGSQ